MGIPTKCWSIVKQKIQEKEEASKLEPMNGSIKHGNETPAWVEVEFSLAHAPHTLF